MHQKRNQKYKLRKNYHPVNNIAFFHGIGGCGGNTQFAFNNSRKVAKRRIWTAKHSLSWKLYTSFASMQAQYLFAQEVLVVAAMLIFSIISLITNIKSHPNVILVKMLRDTFIEHNLMMSPNAGIASARWNIIKWYSAHFYI